MSISACMLQRFACALRPVSRCCYASVRTLVKPHPACSVISSLGRAYHSVSSGPQQLRNVQSMRNRRQQPRKSLRIESNTYAANRVAADVDELVSEIDLATSLPLVKQEEAAATDLSHKPVLQGKTSTSGAPRKRKRHEQRTDPIAVKAEPEALPRAQSAVDHSAIATSHQDHWIGNIQSEDHSEAFVKDEAAEEAEFPHSSNTATQIASPLKLRKVKQTRAKSTPHTKQKSSDLNINNAAEATAAQSSNASHKHTPACKARQAKSKTAVKTEPAQRDQAADAVLVTVGDAAAAEPVPADKPASARRKIKAKTAVKAEPAAALDQVGNAEPSLASDGPVTDANEAAPTTKPRKPRAKATPKVDIAEVVASLNLVPYRDRAEPDKWVGAHVSMGGGLERAVVRAAAIGANAFAMDTRSKRRWDSPPIDVDRAAAFRQACKEFGFGPQHILPHGSYLINLATADPDMYVKSYNAFVDELQRCETLGLGLYNFHPGSTCGLCPAEEGMDRIADAINRAHAETSSVVIVLENMAGAGHSVGHKFEYLSYIIDKVHNKDRVGVCLDTCHLFAGGYDVSTPETFDEVMAEFDKEVGLKYLKGMHVNDSKAALGSRKDRHENVAKGLIGQDCFTFIMNDSRFDGIPLIMETPVQCEGPHIDYKLSLLAGAAVFKGPSEVETGENTDKRDIAWLNSLVKA